MFVSVDEFANAIGRPLNREMLNSIDRVIPRTMEEWLNALKPIGAKVSPVTAVKNFDEVAKLVERDGSVVLLKIFSKSAGGHAVHVFRDFLGRVRLMNRDGRILASLQELGGSIEPWEPVEAARLENVFGKIMDGAHNAGVLTMGAAAATGFSRRANEAVAQAFEIFKAKRTTAPVEARAHHVVGPNETLQDIARLYYRDATKFIAILEANRDKIASVGRPIAESQRLVIPELPLIRQFSRANDWPDRPAAPAPAEAAGAAGSGLNRSPSPSHSPTAPPAQTSRRAAISAPEATAAAASAPSRRRALAAAGSKPDPAAKGSSERPAFDPARSARDRAGEPPPPAVAIAGLDQAPADVVSPLLSGVQASLDVGRSSSRDARLGDPQEIGVQSDGLQDVARQSGGGSGGRAPAREAQTFEQGPPQYLETAEDTDAVRLHGASREQRAPFGDGDPRSGDERRLRAAAEAAQRSRPEPEIPARAGFDQPAPGQPLADRPDEADRLAAERKARDQEERDRIREQQANDDESRRQQAAETERTEREAGARQREQATQIFEREQKLRAERQAAEEGERIRVETVNARLEQDAREQMEVKARLYLAQQQDRRVRDEKAHADDGLSAGARRGFERGEARPEPGPPSRRDEPAPLAGKAEPGGRGDPEDLDSLRPDRKPAHGAADGDRRDSSAGRNNQAGAEADEPAVKARRLPDDPDPSSRHEDGRHGRFQQESPEDARDRQQAEARRERAQASDSRDETETLRSRDEAETRRVQEEAEARRQQEVTEARAREEAEARRQREEAEARRQQEVAAAREREEAEARRQQEEAEARERDAAEAR
ncbi:MAG: hypothetical protein ABR970_22270, partial [Roseiarcus sp.]